MKIFRFALLFPLCFLSCKKDPEPTASAAARLTASAWTYENAGVDNNRDGSIDVALTTLLPGAVPACRLDNSLLFKSDNSGLTDEGATRCNLADPQQSAFNWSFADGETALSVSNNVFTLLNGKARIVALTDRNLSLSRDTVLGGTTYPILIVLKR